MDMKSIISKIKEVLLSTEIKMEEVKTTDGIILSFEVLEVGKEIFTIDENGTNPTIDGTYIFEDGTKVEVMDGLISVITLPEEPVEAPETEVEVEVEAPETHEVPMAKLTERLEQLESETNSMKEMILQLAESISKLNFKKELSKEIETPTLSNEHKQISVQYKNTELNNILKNMYKK